MSIGTVAMMIAALTVPGVVDKGPDFQPYKAPLPAFSGGAGGDHVDALGIEVWSQGSPARPFQILGTLTDDRAIGSYDGPSRDGFVKIIARGAKAAGGDAAILERAAENTHPSLTEPATRNMRQFLVTAKSPQDGVAYRTRFWVIKYLPVAPAATAPKGAP